LAPAVAPVDEFGRDQQSDDEAELGVSVSGSPVGVAAESPVVRQPRVGALGDAAKSEPERLFHLDSDAGLGAALDVEIIETETEDGEPDADLGIVIAAVKVQGLDLLEQSGSGDILERRAEELEVVAVGAVDRPTDRDAVGVSGHGPLPAGFGGTFPVTNGSVPNSNPVTLSTDGTDYWQASYSGDARNAPSSSPRGSETEIVGSVPHCKNGWNCGFDGGCKSQGDGDGDGDGNVNVNGFGFGFGFGHWW
jgi:hypothetical protein